MKKYRKYEEGFTLIEVMASIVILAIVSLVLMSYFSDSLSYAKTNANKTVMVNLARNALVYTEKQDFDTWKTYFQSNATVDSRKCESISNCSLYATLVEQPQVLAAVLNPIVNGVQYRVAIQYQKNLLPTATSSSTTGTAKAQESTYLLPIQISVHGPEEKAGQVGTIVEGYITDEKIR